MNELDYFRAVGQLQSLDPDFSVDSIEAEHAHPGLLSRIGAQTVDL